MFFCPKNDLSPFWKVVMWAGKAAQMGYSWEVGNGHSGRFWEGQWFGNSSLAIQFWPLYNIANEKGKAICDVWDGADLKLTFRRTVSAQLMDMWFEICAIAESITLTEECDTIIWSFNSTGLYSVQSLYAVVSFNGIKPVYTPAPRTQ